MRGPCKDYLCDIFSKSGVVSDKYIFVKVFPIYHFLPHFNSASIFITPDFSDDGSLLSFKIMSEIKSINY